MNSIKIKLIKTNLYVKSKFHHFQKRNKFLTVFLFFSTLEITLFYLLESEHSSVLLKFSESFQNKESFQTLLNKLVMIAPFVKKILKSSDSHVNPKESTNGSTETAKNQPSKPQIKQPNSNQSNPTLKRKSELASENASPTKKQANQVIYVIFSFII